MSDEKGAFKIICVRTGEDVKTFAGETRWFGSGEEAAKHALNLTEDNGEKYQPRRVGGDLEWRNREASRFTDGTYLPVPWDNEIWWCNSSCYREHFAHVSLRGSTRMAYTPDEAHGLLDRQVPIKPGVYLNKYFWRVLSQDSIRQFVSVFSAKYDDLKFELATTADEIEDVYLNGPESCMSHDIGDYLADGRHPAVAYAGGDLAVAFLRSLNPEESDSKYTARVVVWPEKKVFGHIYGDMWRLKELLTKAGYTEGNFYGAKLRRILLRNPEPIAGVGESVFVCPHIDNHNWVCDDGKNLLISHEGHISARSTNGITYDMRPKCHECGSRSSELKNVMNRKGNSQQICTVCAPLASLVRDTHTGSRVRRVDAIVFDNSGNGECLAFVDTGYSEIVMCAESKLPFWRKDAIRTSTQSYISPEVFREKYNYCTRCGDAVRDTNPEKCGSRYCPILLKEREVKAKKLATLAAKKEAARPLAARQ